MHRQISVLAFALVLSSSLVAQSASARRPACGTGSLQVLGGGTLGTLGLPRLQAGGAPLAGLPFSFRVDRARPGSTGILFSSPRRSSRALDPYHAVFHPGVPLLATGFALDGSGAAEGLSELAPVSLALCGSPFVVQAAILDPMAAGGIAFTGGVRGVFGVGRAHPTFPGRVVPVGQDPRGIVLGDFDHDGVQDLAAVSLRTNRVHVLRGRGNGAFLPEGELTVPGSPSEMVGGLFDADEHLDLAVLSRGLRRVYSFRGRGDGTFDALGFVNTGSELVNGLAQADLDEDGVLDLLVPRGVFSGTLRVLRGQGDGTFVGAGTYAVGESPFGIAVADFDEDGHRDVAVACSQPSAVFLLLGVGDGTFLPGPTSFESSGRLASADLDSDSHADLVLGSFPELTLLLGRGDGSFEAKQVALGGESATEVVAADVDRDGRLDLLFSGVGIVGLLRGLEGGSFDAPRSYYVGFAPGRPELADLNGDELLDVVVAQQDSLGPVPGRAVVLLGDAESVFETALVSDIPLEEPQGQLLTEDLDRDGDADLLALGFAGITVSEGDGKGRFHATDLYAEGGSWAVLGDWNGDRAQDLAVTGSASDDVRVFLGDGDGTFAAPASFPVGTGTFGLASADWNEDAALDLVATNQSGSTITFLAGDGTGSFAIQGTAPVGASPAFAAGGDVDGDGHADLVVSNLGSHDVSVLLGDGGGAFSAAGTLASQDPRQLELHDLDRNGFLDLVVVNYTDRDLSLFLGSPGGFLPRTVLRPTLGSVTDFAAEDLDRDGRVDLVVDGETLSVLHGRGDGTFVAGEVFVGGGSLAIADVDGDLMPDVLSRVRRGLATDEILVLSNRILR